MNPTKYIFCIPFTFSPYSVLLELSLSQEEEEGQREMWLLALIPPSIILHVRFNYWGQQWLSGDNGKHLTENSNEITNGSLGRAFTEVIPLSAREIPSLIASHLLEASEP